MSKARVIEKFPEAGEMVVHALGRDWAWDIRDTECWPVVFDRSSDLEVVYAAMRKAGRRFRQVVQAGGNFGTWPWLLAQTFRSVYTFEPDPRCFPFLVRNCSELKNIVYFQSALGNRPGLIHLENTDRETTNLGAQFVCPGGIVPTMRIDDLGLEEVDLIYLDIEGFELFALQGAIKTIDRCKPVIVVEDKTLGERYGYHKGDIENWLDDTFAYSVVARPHRDVVLVPRK